MQWKCYTFCSLNPLASFSSQLIQAQKTSLPVHHQEDWLKTWELPVDHLLLWIMIHPTSGCLSNKVPCLILCSLFETHTQHAVKGWLSMRSLCWAVPQTVRLNTLYKIIRTCLVMSHWTTSLFSIINAAVFCMRLSFGEIKLRVL